MRPTSMHSRPHRESLDLKKLGVQEMDAREMVEVDGGFWGLVVGALIGAALTQDLDSLADAFNEGYNSTRN